MAVKVLELHHHGIRVGPSTEDLSKALAFYRDVLGLTTDPGRPEIPGIPGYWMDLGQTQIHLMGASGPSKYAKGERQDPTLTHVALAVALSGFEHFRCALRSLGENQSSFNRFSVCACPP